MKNKLIKNKMYRILDELIEKALIQTTPSKKGEFKESVNFTKKSNIVFFDNGEFLVVDKKKIVYKDYIQDNIYIDFYYFDFNKSIKTIMLFYLQSIKENVSSFNDIKEKIEGGEYIFADFNDGYFNEN